MGNGKKKIARRANTPPRCSSKSKTYFSNDVLTLYLSFVQLFPNIFRTLSLLLRAAALAIGLLPLKMQGGDSTPVGGNFSGHQVAQFKNGTKIFVSKYEVKTWVGQPHLLRFQIFRDLRWNPRHPGEREGEGEAKIHEIHRLTQLGFVLMCWDIS